MWRESIAWFASCWKLNDSRSNLRHSKFCSVNRGILGYVHQEAKFSLHIITLNSEPGTTKRELGGIFIIQACERCLLFAFVYRAKMKTKLLILNPQNKKLWSIRESIRFVMLRHARLKVKSILFISSNPRDELVEMRECEFTVETRNIVASETKKFVSIYRMTRYFSSSIEL